MLCHTAVSNLTVILTKLLIPQNDQVCITYCQCDYTVNMPFSVYFPVLRQQYLNASKQTAKSLRGLLGVSEGNVWPK